MYAVRDEADRVPDNTSAAEDGNNNNNPDMEKIDELTEQVSSKLRMAPAAGLTKELSLASMLWAHPQQSTMKQHSRNQSGDFNDRIRSDSFGSDSGCLNNNNSAASHSCDNSVVPIYPSHFYNKRDDLRQSVMEAIQEMMSELEDLHKNINDQAVQHIHAGDLIADDDDSFRPESVLLLLAGTGIVALPQILAHRNPARLLGISTAQYRQLQCPIDLVQSCREDDILLLPEIKQYCLEGLKPSLRLRGLRNYTLLLTKEKRDQGYVDLPFKEGSNLNDTAIAHTMDVFWDRTYDDGAVRVGTKEESKNDNFF